MSKRAKLLEAMRNSPRDWRIKPVYIRQFLLLVDGVKELQR